jgi:hypothetical protein
VLCASLAAVAVWAMRDGVAISSPKATAVPAASRPAEAAATFAPALYAQLPQRELPPRGADPFAAHSRALDPSKGAATPAPPAASAVAPPFPYRYVGELVLPDGVRIFVGRGQDGSR